MKKSKPLENLEGSKALALSWRRRVYFRYRKGLVVSIMALVVGAAFFAQLVLANSLATRGGEIKRLEERRSQLLYEISLLEEQAIELRSISRIEREASLRLGMRYDASQFEYLTHPSLAFTE